MCLSFFYNNEEFENQCIKETDPRITHKKLDVIQRAIGPNLAFRFMLQKLTYKKYTKFVYKEFFPAINDARAVLSIGGDNYSLDYGIPRRFTALDDLVLDNHKPIYLWGASVGPFGRIPEYEKYMVKHLQNIDGIFVREPATVEYLKKIGVKDNLVRVADPAFMMDATEPKLDKKIHVNDGVIGINLSPLMAKYVTNGNMQEWIKAASEIVSLTLQKTGCEIYLIPHVTTANSNDYLFLKDVLSNIKDPNNKISLIPPIYNASETKWIISKMKLFAGSRTHSTIAGLSSGVPTLSFAYSIKSKGINEDIYGHDDYCLNPEKLKPEFVVEKIETMLEKNDEIRRELKITIPKIKNKALLAGKYLQNRL